jgi:hypothetical protein
MERTKILFGTDRLDQLQNLNSTTNTNGRNANSTKKDTEHVQNDSKQSAIDLFKTKMGAKNSDDLLNVLSQSSREEISFAITTFLKEIEKNQTDDKHSSSDSTNTMSLKSTDKSITDAAVNTGIPFVLYRNQAGVFVFCLNACMLWLDSLTCFRCCRLFSGMHGIIFH